MMICNPGNWNNEARRLIDQRSIGEIEMFQHLPLLLVRVAQRAVLNLEVQHVLSATPNVPFASSLCQPTAKDGETLCDQ
jgi:hypothetical protein